MDKPNALDLLIEQQAKLANAVESETLEEAIYRLSNLPALEYEKIREAEAKRLEVRVGALDKEVSIARKSKQEEGGKAAMFPTVEPWPEEIIADQLLHEIHKTMRGFIVCSNETAVTVSEVTGELLRYHGKFDPSGGAVKASRVQQLAAIVG